MRTNEPTPAELEVLRLMACGFTTDEIATVRNRSPLTIKTLKASLFRKLVAANAPHAVAIAYERGILGSGQA